MKYSLNKWESEKTLSGGRNQTTPIRIAEILTSLNFNIDFNLFNAYLFIICIIM